MRPATTMRHHPLTPNRLWLALTLWGLLFVGLVYGGSLALPFFFDDFVHLPYVDATSLGEMWRTAGSLAYYRPLTFVLWKLLYVALGHHSPVAQHAINLLLHLLNGLLAAQLAGSLWDDAYRWPRRWLVATLYWLFPFGYQAVPWVGALSQILVTTLLLLALVCYWRAQSSGFEPQSSQRAQRKKGFQEWQHSTTTENEAQRFRRFRRFLHVLPRSSVSSTRKQAGSPTFWYLLSLFFTFLAPFAHENGILVASLLTLLLWTTPGRKLADGVRQGIIWLIPALLWFPIWWLAPKAVSGQIQINGGEPLRQNLTYFAQGLAYPTTWLGGWLRDGRGWGDMVTVLMLVGTGLLLAALILWLGGANRRSLLPWLWWLTAVFPATLLLRFDYVINGPRLLTAASVGIAWLWADVAIKLATWPRGKSVWRYGLVLGLLLGLMGQNVAFIRQRMGLHRMLGTAVNQATQLYQQTAPDPITFINFPSWLAPTTATYALGHEGVQFWPDYAQPNSLVAVQTGQPATVNLVRHDATRAAPPYFYGVSGSPLDWATLLPAAGRIFVADYAADAIVVRPAGAVVAAPAAAPLATFGDNSLLTLHQATATLQPGGLIIDLLWQLNAPPAEEITLFVHAVDQGGQLVAQLDGDPLAGTYPFSHWSPGQTIRDSRWLPLDNPNVTLLVGVYSRQTGERLTAVSSQLADNNAVRVQP
ncbi:MAG: hypothetical protein R3C62_16475 [Chloroflexota bacterium]